MSTNNQSIEQKFPHCNRRIKSESKCDGSWVMPSPNGSVLAHRANPAFGYM